MQIITFDMVKAGLHCSLRMSRQMLPLLLMFGWNTLVRKETWNMFMSECQKKIEKITSSSKLVVWGPPRLSTILCFYLSIDVLWVEHMCWIRHLCYIKHRFLKLSLLLYEHVQPSLHNLTPIWPRTVSEGVYFDPLFVCAYRRVPKSFEHKHMIGRI